MRYAQIPKASILVMTQPIFPSRWQWLKLKIQLYFARAACRQHGHLLTRRSWQSVNTKEVVEYHCGCLNCDLYWEETPNFKRKIEPHYLFAGPRPTVAQLKETAT